MAEPKAQALKRTRVQIERVALDVPDGRTLALLGSVQFNREDGPPIILPIGETVELDPAVAAEIAAHALPAGLRFAKHPLAPDSAAEPANQSGGSAPSATVAGSVGAARATPTAEAGTPGTAP